MDTQIRRLDNPIPMPSPARGKTSANRPTLSLPGRQTAAHAAPASNLVATANKLREAILRCAAEAQRQETKDTEARLHCFIAKLSGDMECLGEAELDHALWDLMKLRTEPQRTYEVDTSAPEQIDRAYS